MKLRRAIALLGTAFALSFGLMLAPSQADAATVTINPRANAVEAGQVLAAPDGSVFTITVYDAGLAAGQKSVTHTFQAGDTLRQTANKLVQAINADTELQAIGVTATLQNGANYTIASTSANGTVYKQTTIGGGSNRLAIQQTLTIGGTITVGDKVTLTIYDAGLVGGKEVVAYKPVTGDTTATIVTKLRNKVNNSVNLAPLGITAKVSTADANVLLIESPTFDATEKFTTYSAKVSTGATETVALGTFWGTNGTQTISVAGPVTPGEVVEFTVFNEDLPDSQKTVSYVVQAGDNLNKVRCGLRTEANNDADLAEIGVHATCGGGVLNLSAASTTSPTAYWEKKLVVCIPVNENPSAWPPAARVKYCKPAGSTNAQKVRETIEALGSSAFPGGANAIDASNKLQNSSVIWYVYANHDDYYDSGDVPFFRKTGGPLFNVIVNPVDPTPANLPFVLGESFGGLGVYYSVIFETSADKQHGVPTGIANPWFRHAAAHETGHQLDFIYGGGTSIADTQTFKDLYLKDLDLMNKVPSCRYNATDGYGVEGDPPQRKSGIWAAAEPFDQTQPVDYGGLPGLFTGVLAANGSEICSDRNANYGGSNQQIVEEAFPFFKPKDGSGIRNLPTREVFSEIYAWQTNFPDSVDNSGAVGNGSDNVFNTGAFACTKLFVQKWTQFGRAPTADELHNTGYSVPDIVPAGDPDAGAFGFGERLNACDGTIGDLNHYGFGS